MRKIVIAAGILAAVVAGSGLIALGNSGKATADAVEDVPAATASPSAAPSQPQKTPPPNRPGQQGKPAKPAKGCDTPDASAASAPSADTGARPSGDAGRSAADSTSTTVQGDYTVTISGGFDTDPQDHGRPVALIAAALGVPADVFREAFSGVTPAGPDRGPTDEEARSNKAALLKVLAPYGITNDRLDEVSNFYRYNAAHGDVWQRTLATAAPIVKDGVLTGISITKPGAGYTTAPTVTIKGPDGTVTATAKIAYTEDFATNGSIASLTLN